MLWNKLSFPLIYWKYFVTKLRLRLKDIKDLNNNQIINKLSDILLTYDSFWINNKVIINYNIMNRQTAQNGWQTTLHLKTNALKGNFKENNFFWHTFWLSKLRIAWFLDNTLQSKTKLSAVGLHRATALPTLATCPDSRQIRRSTNGCEFLRQTSIAWAAHLLGVDACVDTSVDSDRSATPESLPLTRSWSVAIKQVKLGQS